MRVFNTIEINRTCFICRAVKRWILCARGATDESDVDVIVVGGDRFRTTDIFAFGEELRELIQTAVEHGLLSRALSSA